MLYLGKFFVVSTFLRSGYQVKTGYAVQYGVLDAEQFEQCGQCPGRGKKFLDLFLFGAGGFYMEFSLPVSEMIMRASTVTPAS